MIDFNQKYELIKIWLNSINGKTLIICHYDADGLTSAILFSRILEKFNQTYNKDFFVRVVRDSYRGDYVSSNSTKKDIEDYDNVILLDYCFDSYSDLEKKTIFVIDHHKSGEKDKDYILNPSWTCSAEELPSSSAIIYDFYYYLFGENKLLKKIACIGSASDFMIYGSLPYLHTNTNDIDLFMSNSQLLKPIVFDIFKKLEAIYETKGQEQILFDHLFTNTKNNLDGFIDFSKDQIEHILNREREELIYTKQILDTAEVNDNKKYVIIEIPYEHKILKKKILNLLELYYSDYTKMTYIKRTKFFSCSIRSVSLNVLKIINDLKKEHKEFSGGGHEFASGCAGPVEKIDYLINAIKEKLKE